MSEIQTSFQKSLAREISINAVVLKKCECGEKQTGWSACPSCGAAAVVVNHGTVAYYHRNFFMRVLYRVKRWMGWV